MVRFITGGPGSGKTVYITELIAADLKAGEKVILLVPEQQAVVAERRVGETLKGVPAINLEILNFTRLCNRVFREYGGIAYDYLSKGAYNIIMWRSLYSLAGSLTEYSPVAAGDRSFIVLMTALIREFKNCGVMPDQLEEAARGLESENGDLAAKLRDISLIYSFYQSALQNEFNALSDELKTLAMCLRRREFFKEYSVYIDSFNGFTAAEYEIIKYIFIQSRRVFVTVNIDIGDERFIFSGIRSAYEKLKSLAKEYGVETAEPIRLSAAKKPRFRNGELEFLASELYKGEYFGCCGAEYEFKPENIRAVECNSLYSEAEFIAKDILKKVRGGARYKDIVIITRDVSLYYGVIDAVLERYGVPFFMSVRIDLQSKALIKLILSALTVIQNHWRAGDVVAYIKTGLSGITRGECDVLEAYITAWNISGRRWTDDRAWTLNPAGYTDKLNERGMEILKTVNELKSKLTAPLKRFGGVFADKNKCSVRKACEALYEFLIELGVPGQLAEKDKENERLWNALADTLDQLVLICGGSEVTADEYSRLLSLALGEADIGRIPASLDETVIGNADKLRIADVNHVYLLGVNDGVFPQFASDGSVFSDGERSLMENHGVDLNLPGDRDPEKKSIEELLYFYLAAVCARDTVTMVYSSSDLNGRKQKPSQACGEIMKLFPAMPVERYKDFLPGDLAEGYGESYIYSYIYKDAPAGAALKKIYSLDKVYSERMEADKIPLSQKEYILPPEQAGKLFGGDIILPQSRLDAYVLCPFSYCCKYMIRLAETRQAAFRSVDVGNFIHRILELYLSKFYSEGVTGRIPSDGEITTLLDEIIDGYKTSMYGGAAPENANKRIDHMLARLKKSAFLLIRDIHDEFAQSRFIPRCFEEPIAMTGGKVAAPYKIELDGGGSVYVTGVIDRIDTFTDGHKIYLRVVDYKTGVKDFSMADLGAGLNLQMLLYLFALWTNPSGEFRQTLGGGEILPAGVLYFSARVPDVTINTEEEQMYVIEFARKKLTRKGVLLKDEKILDAMERGLGGKIIAAEKNRTGELRSKNRSMGLVDDFSGLMQDINKKIYEIGTKLRSGDMSADPLIYKQHDACKFCSNKPVCRIEADGGGGETEMEDE